MVGGIAATAAQVKWIYGNSRGLRQGSGEFKKAVVTHKPTFWAMNECHLDDDPAKALIPSGYKVVCRLDRNNHGGGLLMGAEKHLLVDSLNMHKYNLKGVAEMVGFTWADVDWILYYTSSARAAVTLLEMMRLYREEHPGRRVVFIGDMNAHNSDWLCGTDVTDEAGMLAEELCEMYGMKQIVDFPTRGLNTLDLVISDIEGEAVVAPGFGNSDHESMRLNFDVSMETPKPPEMQYVRDWINAPWPHAKGDLKRSMVEFMKSTEQDVDKLEHMMDRKIAAVVDKHVKWKRIGGMKPSPWWNQACDVALKWKQECFSCRCEKVEEYKKAVKFSRKV